MTTDPTTTDPRSEETPAYEVRLDRDACDGIFACLVRDDRFEEASDGLATVAGWDGTTPDGEMSVSFEDDRIETAQQAARACPVDAITVETVETDAAGGGSGE